MLQPTFKILKVNFDTKTVDNIIKEIKGVSKNTLYQLKMVRKI